MLTFSCSFNPKTIPAKMMTVPRTAAATYGTQSPGCRYNSVLHSSGRFCGSLSVAAIPEAGYGGVMMSCEFGMMASRSVVLPVLRDTPTERRYDQL